MGFQLPPTLPDYSKLSVLLNNSGVQKWNPSVYDILKQLIFAVQQSQNVVSDIIGTPLTVDPNGALDSPALKVRVDGSTISINGSNQLQALSTQLVFAASGGGTLKIVAPNTANSPFAAHTIFGTIPAVANKTIWPIAIYVTGGQTLSGGTNGLWNTATGWEVVWNGVGTAIAAGSGQIFTTVAATSAFTTLLPFTAAQLTITASAFRNIDLNIRTSNVGTILGSTDASTTLINAATWSLIYTLI